MFHSFALFICHLVSSTETGTLIGHPVVVKQL